MNFTILAGLVLSGYGPRRDDGANLEVRAGDRRLFGTCVSQIAAGTAD